MGALVTLDLSEGAPALDLPWIITFGPLSEDEDWEPVVVGPYERSHAMALAEEIVADDDLMAVVEPLLPRTSVEEIRAEIAAAIATSKEVESEEEPDLDYDEDEGYGEGAQERPEPPTPEEVQAGIARIAAKLTSGSLGSTIV